MTDPATGLAVLPDAGRIEVTADPAAYVVLACERAKAWLADALEHGDIDGIVELKSQAEAIRVYTAQKQLGRDAELSAQEIVRRAERGIGVAIRRGQEAGEIRRRGERENVANQHGPAVPADARSSKSSPYEFASEHELRGSGGVAGIYDMTDGVSDDQFEAAIGQAKTEENLSRANVVRKVRDVTNGEPTAADNLAKITDLAGAGHTSRQIAAAVGYTPEKVRRLARKHHIEITADRILGRARLHDPNRIVRETVHGLEGLTQGIGLVRVADLDPDEVGAWVASLSNSIRVLNRLIKQMKEATQS